MTNTSLNSTLPEELTPNQTAALIGRSTGFVYLLMNEGELEHRAVTRRGKTRGRRLIKRASVERWLAQRESLTPGDSNNA
jgi:Helix-turn-helix domain